MRAPINSTKLPDDARLGVFAYYHGTTVQSYLKDVIFGKKGGTDNTWAGIDNDGNSRPYYWPTSGTLDLFAYHPWFEGEQIKVVDQNNEIIGFAGEAIDIANSQYDLMYTDMLIGRTAADAGTTGIPMTMHHALTQVVVNIKKTEATPKLVVTKVTLNNVFLKADAFSCWYILITQIIPSKKPLFIGIGMSKIQGIPVLRHLQCLMYKQMRQLWKARRVWR